MRQGVRGLQAGAQGSYDGELVEVGGVDGEEGGLLGLHVVDL